MESSQNQKIFQKTEKDNLQTKLILKGHFLLILSTATGSIMAPSLLQIFHAVQAVPPLLEKCCFSALIDAFYYAPYHADILFPNLSTETHLFFSCF